MNRDTRAPHAASMSCFILAGILLPALLSAQSPWLERGGRHMFGVEYLRPNFAQDNGYTGGTCNLVFSYQGVLTREYTLKAEVPFSRFDREANGAAPASTSDQVFGNPYVGVEIYRPNFPAWVEAGIFLPVTSSHAEANAVARVIDPDRPEFFLRKVTSLKLSLNRQNAITRNVHLFLSLGALGWIGLDKNYLNDGFELFFPYALQLSFDSRYVAVHTGLTGRYWATPGSGVSFADSWTHQFGVSVNFHIRSFHPGLLLRVPLNKGLEQEVRSTFGVHATLML